MARSVLVVDDDDWTRELLVTVLQNEGYDVAAARDGLEAVRRVEQREPALIVLDLMMPRMDGLTFTHELEQRGLRSSIPILLLSADTRTREKAARLGAAAYIEKPFALDTLLHQVSRLAAGCTPLRA